MGKSLREWIQHKKRKEIADRKPLSKEERMAFVKIRREAAEAGAILANGGRGGLPPSFVLNVLRRDKYRCKIHGDRGEGEHGGLTLHHKGGIVESEWLSKKGHKTELNNLVTICSQGHDQIHTEARENGDDSTQVTPQGDIERKAYKAEK